MRASQIYLILLPVLGMAQAAAVPSVEQVRLSLFSKNPLLKEAQIC